MADTENAKKSLMEMPTVRSLKRKAHQYRGGGKKGSSRRITNMMVQACSQNKTPEKIGHLKL